MKKVLKVLSFLMCAIMLFALAACAGPHFMSASKVKRAVKEFGTPQAEMTLNFSSNGKKMKYVITYDILLDKAPISSINFINLVNDGFYNEAVFESYNTSYNYYLAGRYTYKKTEESGSARVYENVSGITMPGEFKSNLYREPEGGYAQFSMFSLAMYHANDADSFDTANGALIFSTSVSDTLNYANYAVFAKMSSISIYENDGKIPQTYPGDKMASAYLEQLTKLTSTTSCTVTTAEGDSKSVTILGASSVPRYVFSIKMLGGSDWSKLPKVN